MLQKGSKTAITEYIQVCHPICVWHESHGVCFEASSLAFRQRCENIFHLPKYVYWHMITGKKKCESRTGTEHFPGIVQAPCSHGHPPGAEGGLGLDMEWVYSPHLPTDGHPQPALAPVPPFHFLCTVFFMAFLLILWPMAASHRRVFAIAFFGTHSFWVLSWQSWCVVSNSRFWSVCILFCTEAFQ